MSFNLQICLMTILSYFTFNKTHVYCLAMNYITQTTYGAKLGNMIMICITRYMATKPRFQGMSGKSRYISLTAVWLFSGLYCCTIYLFIPTNVSPKSCLEEELYTEKRQLVFIVRGVYNVVLLILTAVFSIATAINIMAHRRRIIPSVHPVSAGQVGHISNYSIGRALQDNTTINTITGMNRTPNNKPNTVTTYRNMVRAYRTVCLYLVSFVLLTGPYLIATLISIVRPPSTSVLRILQGLTIVNSILDVILHIWRLKIFRRQ